MQAELHLDFASGPHATSFRCLKHNPPWKVVRGFTLESGACLVHLNNVSGGIFGGDQLKLLVNLQPHAEAQITTTGATRIYRPLPQASDSILVADFQIARGALLEYLPDALIPFRQARLFQRTSFSLEEGATLFCWDTIAPGRAAAGEFFAYEHLKIVSEIKALGTPILTDRLLLSPQHHSVRAPAAFLSANYLVTFVAMQAGLSAAEVTSLEETLLAVASESDSPAAWGVTTLPAHGVMVRGTLNSSVSIPRTIHKFWAAAKLQICRRVAIAPRKIY